MTAITAMTSSNADAILNSVKEALADVADQYGLSFDLSSLKRDAFSLGGQFRLKVMMDSDGNVIDPDKEQFERFAGALGIDPTWYKKRFASRGAQYEVVGLLPNRPKNCVQIKRIRDGKTFVCPPDFVRTGI